MRIFTALVALVFCVTACAQLVSTPSVTYESFATVNDAVGIYNSGVQGDERLFIVRQSGSIVMLDLDGNSLGTFLNVTGLSTGGERGLLGLAFSPDYASDGRFYVNYTNGSGDTNISRFSVSSDPNAADASSEEVLLTIVQDFGNHNGGHIAFGPDGMLYVGMGDGGSGGDPNNRAQDINSLLGKMLRIDVTPATGYDIPADNPYVGVAGEDEIYSIGLRNPWKFDFDPNTGDLWIADVGQNAREEVNFSPNGTGLGANYGWRCFEGFSSFNSTGCNNITHTEPLRDYTHGNPYNFCSITGGEVYRGGSSTALEGHYLFMDYCDGRLFSLAPDGNGDFVETELNSQGGFGGVAFGRDINGEVYAVRNLSNIVKIVQDCIDFAPSISQVGSANIISASEGTSFVWYVDGLPDANASGNSYSPAFIPQQTIYAIVENEEGCTYQTNSLDWSLATGVLGCTYLEAENFTPIATIDDGSCFFTNPGPDCAEDINGDGSVDGGDIIMILAAFGGEC